MIKLLRANLARTIKSKTFWICLALYALYPILLTIILNASYPSQNQTVTNIDKVFLLNYGTQSFPFQGIIIAIFCTMIFSADFNNGTIRNKIIFGHSKSTIYLSNMLSTMIISLTLSVIYFLIYLIIAMPVLGKPTFSANTVFWILFNGTIMLMAYSSIMTMIVMSCKNPIASILLAFAILSIIGVLVVAMDYVASIPPYIKWRSYDELGNIIYTYEPNPSQPSKKILDFAQFIVDVFPSGQSLQISRGEYTHNWQMALYSLGMIGATTGAGIAIFNKSNIK